MPLTLAQFRYDDADRAHAAEWLRAAARDDVRQRLQTIYNDVAQRIAARGPACWASGRCCHFENTGHRLYTTGLEAAATVLDRAHIPGAPELTAPAIDRALAQGNCPFQVANRCAVHPARPLGCRVYFCDRTAQSWQHTLSEHAQADIRQLHDEHHIPYHYAEWRYLLGALLPQVPNA